MTKQKSTEKSEFDSPWKDAIDLYFEDFLAYCLPSIHKKINWSQGYKMLEKELGKISRGAITTNRVADKLIEVQTQDQQPLYFFIHLEIEASSYSDIAERMLVYRYRLRDLYKKEVVSIVFLIDPNPNWQPTHYREEYWGSYIEVGFLTIKLLDYQSKKEELECSSNRFAQIMLAQLAILEKGTLNDKMGNKIQLTKRLYQFGWNKEDIFNLYRLIDWIIKLPLELEIQYNEIIETFEQEEVKMAYITTAERIGIQKGREEGKILVLLELLQRKFNTIPDIHAEKIKTANTETQLKWIEKLFFSKSIEEVFEE